MMTSVRSTLRPYEHFAWRSLVGLGAVIAAAVRVKSTETQGSLAS